ncbi:MAG: PfkB family carbohydrate kinase [Caldilineaceae bacterium]
MNYPGRFRDHILADQLENITLSFLVDSMRRQKGGVAANIAYTNRLLGGSPVIFSTVGQDFGDYRRWLEEMGLDTSHLITLLDDFGLLFLQHRQRRQADLQFLLWCHVARQPLHTGRAGTSQCPDGDDRGRRSSGDAQPGG